MGDEAKGGPGLPYATYQGAYVGQEQAGARRRGRWRGAAFATSAVAIVAVLVVVIVVVLTGGSDVELRAHGAPIENASAALREAEDRVREELLVAEANGLDASFEDRAGCWYSYPAGDTEPNDFLRCGPVAFADSSPGAYWLDVPVRFSSAGDATQVRSMGPPARRTHTLAPGEELLRPDGAPPPAPATIDLERPPATPAEPGKAGVLEPDDLMIELDKPDDGRIIGVGHNSEVLGVGTTDRVRLTSEPPGESTVFEAAEGEEWLVFELTADRDVLEPGQIADAVVVDGDDRRPLRGVSPPWGSGTVSTRIFAVSVPVGADETTLVVGDEVAEQSWSFTTRERGDNALAVLYRDAESRRAEVDQEFRLPYAAKDLFAVPTIPSPGGFGTLHGIDRSRAFGDLELSVRIAEARLDYAVDVMTEPNRTSTKTAGGSDRALLYLHGMQMSWDELEHEDFSLAPENAVLTLDDGTRVAAAHMGLTVTGRSAPGGPLAGLDAGGGVVFSGIPVWEVPADIRSATATIRPGSAENGIGSFNLDFRDGVIQFELDFR